MIQFIIDVLILTGAKLAVVEAVFLGYWITKTILDKMDSKRER